MKSNREYHGDTGRRLYTIWLNMKNRCYGEAKAKERDSYDDLDVCDEWRHSYITFRSWSMTNGYNDTLSIDRVDNSKGYSPDNCRWADLYTQNQNQRVIKTSNTSGFRGVYKYEHRNKQWWAYINVNGKRKSLGYYYSPYQAAAAYNEYVLKICSEHPINELSPKNLMYLISDLGDFCDIVNKGRDITNHARLHLAHLDGIARLKGTTLSECWEHAYNDIKDRKGYMNENGVFIKEGDNQ